jgi:hypothetical protein
VALLAIRIHVSFRWMEKCRKRSVIELLPAHGKTGVRQFRGANRPSGERIKPFDTVAWSSSLPDLRIFLPQFAAGTRHRKPHTRALLG